MPAGDAFGWWTRRDLTGRQKRLPQTQATREVQTTREESAAHLLLAEWGRHAIRNTNRKTAESVEEMRSSGPAPFWCYAKAMRCDSMPAASQAVGIPAACCPCCPWCAFLLPSMPENHGQGEGICRSFTCRMGRRNARHRLHCPLARRVTPM